MKNLLVWYLPQAALFFGTGYLLHMDAVAKGEQPNVAAMLIVCVMMAAAYTGGVNLIMSLAARFRRHAQARSASAEQERLSEARRALGRDRA